MLISYFRFLNPGNVFLKKKIKKRNSEPYQRSKMERIAKTVNGLKPLLFLKTHSI